MFLLLLFIQCLISFRRSESFRELERPLSKEWTISPKFLLLFESPNIQKLFPSVHFHDKFVFDSILHLSKVFVIIDIIYTNVGLPSISFPPIPTIFSPRVGSSSPSGFKVGVEQDFLHVSKIRVPLPLSLNPSSFIKNLTISYM